MGRPKGSKNKKQRTKFNCNTCNVDLVVGKNWRDKLKQNSHYFCNKCKSNQDKQFKLDDPERYIQIDKHQRIKEGTGVYQIMLGEICMYVGEGQLYSRRTKHLEYNGTCSSVVKYCLKHNINRSLLSFNVLEYEDNKTRMEQLEDWYITFLTPIINPKPPLGLYV
jgi:hypothetical protein